MANLSITHCKRGHEFNEANTYWRKEGRRMCRICEAERKREKYEYRPLTEDQKLERMKARFRRYLKEGLIT